MPVSSRQHKKSLMKRFLSSIPLRTKLIFVGAVIGVVIAIPMILSMGGGGGRAGEPGRTISVADQSTAVIEETPAAIPAASPTPSPEPSPTADTSTPSPTVKTVGGIIDQDTTWTPSEGPYELTERVIVREGVTLTIEPGTVIIAENGGDLFWIDGTIIAHGTPENPIIFDGKGKSNFFTCPPRGSGKAVLDLDFATIKDGIRFWNSLPSGRFESLSLKNATLMNIAEVSNIFYPKSDVHIECNTFINIAGFSIRLDGSTKVYFQYNTFRDSTFKRARGDFWIQNEQCIGGSQTLVRYNSFDPADGMALKLAGEEAGMIAIENYWNTQDTGTIASMISGPIPFEPILPTPPECPPTPAPAP